MIFESEQILNLNKSQIWMILNQFFKILTEKSQENPETLRMKKSCKTGLE